MQSSYVGAERDVVLIWKDQVIPIVSWWAMCHSPCPFLPLPRSKNISSYVVVVVVLVRNCTAGGWSGDPGSTFQSWMSLTCHDPIKETSFLCLWEWTGSNEEPWNRGEKFPLLPWEFTISVTGDFSGTEPAGELGTPYQGHTWNQLNIRLRGTTAYLPPGSCDSLAEIKF